MKEHMTALLRGALIKTAVALACVSSASSVMAAVDLAVLERAEALAKAGRHEEAYKLLEPLEIEGAGDEVYDYLLATAALESGRPSKATFVYERILAARPGFVGVRADMGRAYYALGDFARAKVEFETVLTFQNLPPDLRQSVEQYVRAAEARAQAKRTIAGGYVEIGVGRDSNVGSATGEAVLNLPGAGLYNPTPPMGLKTDDSYASVALGGEINHQLTEQWGLYAGGDLRARGYSNYAPPGYSSFDIRGGASYSGGAWLLRAGLAAGSFWQNSDRVRDSLGISTDWRMAVQGGGQVNAGLSVTKLSYVPAQARQDMVATTLNGGWLLPLSNGTALANFSLTAGYENAVGGRDDGDKRFWGPRVLLQKTFNPDWGGFISVGATKADYSLANPLYLFARSEVLVDATVALTWTMAKGISLRPQVTWMRNASNAELFSYDKADLSVNLRFDF